MDVLCGRGVRSDRCGTADGALNDSRDSWNSMSNSPAFGQSSDLLPRGSHEEFPSDAGGVIEVARALGQLMARCRGALEAQRLDVIAAVWRTERLLGGLARTSLVGDGIQVVAGRRAMARALADAYGQARSSRLGVYSSPFMESVGGRHGPVDARLAAMGVRLRAVYQQSQAQLLPRLPRVEVRRADLVPMDMVVVDDRLAVLPIDPDRPGFALTVVSDPAWVQLACVLAENCWSRAEGAGDVR